MLFVFDVNETLLDLAPLDAVVARALGAAPRDASARKVWFDRMIRSALTLTAARQYVPFGALAGASLRDLAAERDVDLAEEHLTALARGIRHLPAHADVAPGLKKLRAQGHRVVALTNSVLEVAEAQLRSSDLFALVDAVYSADAVHRLKPAPEPYRMVLELEQVTSTTLVAAHDWDVAGAAAAGLETVFVRREGRRSFSAVDAPSHVVADLNELAALTETWT